MADNDELEKLRSYKTLTKLRMKQAAEKLGSYRVQVEDAQKTIQDLQATNADLQAMNADNGRLIAELRAEVTRLQRAQVAATRQPIQRALSTPVVAPVVTPSALATPVQNDATASDGASSSSSDDDSVSDAGSGILATGSDTDSDDDEPKTVAMLLGRAAAVATPKAPTPLPRPTALVPSTTTTATTTATRTATTETTAETTPTTPTEMPTAAATTDTAPTAKKRKRDESMPQNINRFLQVASMSTGSSIYRATKILALFYNAVFGNEDKVATSLLLLPKLQKAMRHHQIPITEVTSAFVATAPIAKDIALHVDVLSQVASRPSDAAVALATITQHVGRKKNLPMKLQVGWCRVHTLFSHRIGSVAATKAFLIDRLAAPNRHVFDFVAIAECWPLAFTQLASTASTSLLAVTVRYLLGTLIDGVEDNTELQMTSIQNMYALCGGAVAADADAITAGFLASTPTNAMLFEMQESLRLLCLVLGYAGCIKTFPSLLELLAETTPVSVRLLGVTAATLLEHPCADEAADTNAAKSMIERLLPVVQNTHCDPHLRAAAAIGLLEVASRVSAKTLAKEYLSPVLLWFGSQTPSAQLAMPSGLLRKLQNTVVTLA